MKKSLAIILFGPLLFGALGCSSKRPVAKLTGNITFEKKPVLWGSLTVVSEDGKAKGFGRLNGDGTYIVDEAPVGLIRIAFQAPKFFDDPSQGKTNDMLPRDAAGKMKGMMKDKGAPGGENAPEITPEQKAAAKWLEGVHVRYRSWEHSGLTTTIVAKKENTFDIVLQK